MLITILLEWSKNVHKTISINSGMTGKSPDEIEDLCGQIYAKDSNEFMQIIIIKIVIIMFALNGISFNSSTK